MPFVALGIEGLVDLGVLAAFCFCVALDFAYALTLGFALIQIANALDKVSNDAGWFGFLFSSPAGWIHAVDNGIRNQIGQGVTATEYAWHKVLQFTASTLTGIGEAMAYVAAETVRGFERMTFYLVPHLINTATRPVARAANTAGHVATSTARSVPAEITKIYKVTKTYPRTIEIRGLTLAKAALDIRAAARAAVEAIAIPSLRPIERDIAAINKRLKEVANLAGIGTIVGIGAYALSKLGLTSQQCSNNKKFSKGLCGLGSKVIDDLLSGLVAIVGTVSLITLAEDYQGLFSNVTKEAVKFWRADVVGPPHNPVLGTTGFGGSYSPPGGIAQGNPALGDAGL